MKNFTFEFERLDCRATTNGAMRKWIPQLDLAHQLGQETTVQDILIVVENSGRGGRIKAAGIFHPQKFEALWLVALQPKELWTNAYRSLIRSIK